MIATAVLLIVTACAYAALVIDWPRVNARRARRVPLNPCWPECTCRDAPLGRQRSRRGRRRASPSREVT